MGQTQATLVDLLDRQARCDSERVSRAPDQRRATECIEISDALAKMAGELAEEARKTGASAPNAVFFYRRAATAAWRSELPKAMKDAITYAKAATDICARAGAASEVPPGDCALAALIPALVTHDEGLIAFRPLSRPDGVGNQEARRIHLLGEKYGERTWPADVPLVGASNSAYSGWRALRDAAAKATCHEVVDRSVQDYVRDVHADMVNNLHSMSQTIANAADRSHADNDSEYKRVCGDGDSVTPNLHGAKFHERVKSELWCRWQYAKRNPPACPAPAPAPGG